MKGVTSVLEDNYIEFDIDCWVGRGKKLIKIPLSGHLRYNRFKQNIKSNNYIHQMLEGLSNNVEGTFSSSLINLFNYSPVDVEFHGARTVGKGKGRNTR